MSIELSRLVGCAPPISPDPQCLSCGKCKYLPVGFPPLPPPFTPHLVPYHTHRVYGQGDDVEESSLALGDSALGAVHERADRLAQRPLAVALTEHLLGKKHEDMDQQASV